MLPAPTAPSEGYAGVRNLDPLPCRLRSVLDPGSPAQASLPIVFIEARGLLIRRCSAALLGIITSASRFAQTVPKYVSSRVAQKEDHLFRRLSRLARFEPESSPHCLPAEIGSLVTCRTILPLPAVWGGWDRCPDHPLTMHPATSRAKQKRCAQACG